MEKAKWVRLILISVKLVDGSLVGLVGWIRIRLGLVAS